MCPGCDQPVDACTCNVRKDVTPETDGIVRVALDTKGRKGRGVTVVTGIPLPPSELAILGKQLKQRCGSGGTVKDGSVEIQGDHRDLLVQQLQERGWTVKRVGG